MMVGAGATRTLHLLALLAVLDALVGLLDKPAHLGLALHVHGSLLRARALRPRRRRRRRCRTWRAQRHLDWPKGRVGAADRARRKGSPRCGW